MALSTELRTKILRQAKDIDRVNEQISANVVSNANRAEAARASQQSAQIAPRLDNPISAPVPSMDKSLIGKATDATVKPIEIPRPGSVTEGLFKKPNYVSNLAPGLAGMANSLITAKQESDADVKARETEKKNAEQQKASLEKALNDLYQQMEGYKNNGQTDKVLAAEKEYADINERIAKTQATINGISSKEAAVWEAKRYTEIMSTGDKSLMYNLRRLIELRDTKKREAGLQGDDRRSTLTETETKYNEIYNSLKAKYGEQVDGWIAYAERMGNKSAMTARMNEARQAAEDKPFWSSIGSVPLNMASGAGYLDVIGQNLQRSITGSDAPIDYNSPAQSASKMTNTIRGTVSEDMSGVGKFLYNTGMSMADTLAAMPMGNFGMAMLGGSAATNAMQTAIERGASDGQALKIGLAAGAMEAVMEKMSIDKLFKLKTPEAAKDVVLNILKQAGAEGTEEGLTTLANTLADHIIMGDKSELNAAKRAYMAEGYTADKAEGMALKDWGLGLLTDIAGGALSGGMFAGAKATVDMGNGRIATGPAAPRNDSVKPTPQQPKVQPVPNATQNVKTQPVKANPNQKWEKFLSKNNGSPSATAFQNFSGSLNDADSTAFIAYLDAQEKAGNLKWRGDGTPVMTMPADDHIDNRDYGSVGDPKVKSFQYNNPELQPFMQEGLQILADDLDHTLPGERYYNGIDPNGVGSQGLWSGQKRHTSPEIAMLKDDFGMSYEAINKAMDDLAQDAGRENNANAKRLELVIDQILTHGHRTLGGTEFPPNQAYIEAKGKIAGAKPIQQQTETEVEELPMMPGYGKVGDIGAKTSDFRHEVKKSQTHGIDAVEDMLGVPEDQRKKYVHDVVTEQESLYNANLRLEQDYEGEKNYLRNTLQWTGEDVDTAHQILEDLGREAAAAGTEEAWDNYHEWRDVVQKHESSLGGGLQAIAKYARKTGSKIVQRASEAIMDARDGTDRAETMNTVADYAKQYDKAVGKKDVDSLLQIIRDTSVTRRTGSLRHNELSKTMNWALDRIAEYAKAELANPKKVEATENTPVVPQANYTVKAGDKVTVSDRNNIGTVTSVNDDGTYTVHFKSRQGSEATKTFSGDMVTKLGHKTAVVSNTSTIHEVGRFYSFLENFAASGIEAIATDKQKTSFGKAVLTIRRNAMLSKAATIMRNLVGNNVFDPLDSVANNMSVPLDMLLSTITGTRSVAVDKSWFSKAKRKGSLDALAMAMLEVGLDVNAGGAESKYETKGTRTFHMANGPFSKLMSQWEKYMGYAMNATDEFQKGGIAAETQRGIDRLYEQGKIKDDTLRNAGEKEAQYRTFQDESIPAQMTQGLRQLGNILHAGDIGAGDVLIPFAQVPANLPARVADYSPVGLARGIGKMAKVLYDAKKGNLTAAQQASAVKDIGRGITGSGMIAAAAALAAKGIIRVVNPGGEDENKDKAASEKAQGLNGTQWNLNATIRAENGESAEWQDGDTIMSIAFLDPINGMLTTGALLAEDYKEARKNGDKLSVGDILADSLSGTIQSFLDLPVMQTMRDVYNAYQYSDGERPIEKLGDMATAFVSSTATSFIPNALKGLAQGLDPYQRDLYAKDDLLGQTIDQMIGSVPGMRDRLTAKQDVYGNDVKNPDQPLNFLNANILPGAITTYTETDLQKALNDLSEQTGKNSMYLSKDAPKSITVDDEKIELTAEQKKQFMSDRGDVYAEASSALENDETYQGFSKEWKLKAYEYAETYANEKAKNGLNADYEPETWVSDLEGASQDEIAEAMVQKVVSSVANKHKGGKYAGLGDMLDSGTIEDKIAISLLPQEQYDRYMKYGKGVPATDLMDALAYKNSDASKGLKDEDGKDIKGETRQDHVKAWLDEKYKGSANRKIKIGIWCTLYAESTCQW